MLYASQAYNDDFNLTRLKAAVYWSLGKNIFAIGIAVFIFGMTQGAGCKNRFNYMKITKFLFATFLRVSKTILRMECC